MKNKGVGDLYNGIASQLRGSTRDARPKDRRPADRRARPPKAEAAPAKKPDLRVVDGGLAPKPAELPITMLWLSNGGRDYAPWSGRHLGVLGIEDGRAAVGHAASIGDNWLKREGVATAFALGEGHSFSFRHVIGAVPLSGGIPPQEIITADGQMRLSAGGSTRDVPFDSAFLRIGQPVAA